MPEIPRGYVTNALAPDRRTFMEGWDALKSMNMDKARKIFEDGYRAKPKSVMLRYGLAATYYRMWLYDEAYQTVCIKLPNDNAYEDLMKLIGLIYVDTGAPQDAIEYYDYLVKTDYHNVENFRLRGVAFVESGNLDSAKRDLAFIQKIDPKNRLTKYLEGIIAIEESRYQNAATSLLLALGQGVNDCQTYERLSFAYAQMHDFDRAYGYLDAAQKISHYDLGEYRDALKDVQYDWEHRETLPARRWLLAAGGPLAMQNDEGFMSLAGEINTPANKIREQKSLAKWWGIHNRKELYATVASQQKDGHSSVWIDIWQASKKLTGSAQQKIKVLKNKFPEESESQIKTVLQYGNRFGERGILAWDLGRNIAVARFGYLCGYINEHEAFELMLQQAPQIQKTYTSWDQYLTEYYIGRQFWMPGEKPGRVAEIKRKVRQLQLDKNCAWNNLPWQTPLTFEGVFPGEVRKAPIHL